MKHSARSIFFITILLFTGSILFDLQLKSYNLQLTSYAHAADFTEIQPNLKFNIPTLQPFTKITKPDDAGNIFVSYLPQYISAIYSYAVGIAGIFAVALIMWGGMKWIFSMGDVGEAQKTIQNAVIGLILALGSYLLLYMINPSTVAFSSLRLRSIPPATLRETDLFAGQGEGPRRGGLGNKDAANLMQCPDLKNGNTFNAAFTTYYNVSKAGYGQSGNYAGIYHGADPAMANGLGDFFCKISMECGCPSTAGYTSDKTCVNARGKSWNPCKFFDVNTAYCPIGNTVPGQTVAASSCFPMGCKLAIGDHIVTVADRGSGIIGTHFDLYLGVENTPEFMTNTNWLTTNVTILGCPGTVSDKEKNHLYRAYNTYAPGLCVPGKNC